MMYLSTKNGRKKKEALRLAMYKLPVKCKIVSRKDLEGGEANEG